MQIDLSAEAIAALKTDFKKVHDAIHLRLHQEMREKPLSELERNYDIDQDALETALLVWIDVRINNYLNKFLKAMHKPSGN